MDWTLLLTLLFTITRSSSDEPNTHPIKIHEVRNQVVISIDRLWNRLNENNDVNFVEMTDIQLMEGFKRITRIIADMESEIINLDNITKSEFAPIKHNTENLEEYFETFRRLQMEPIRNRHELAWTDMATYIISNSDNGINKTQVTLHQLVNTNDGHNVFIAITQDNIVNVCEMQQSQQQLIYQIYNMIALAELKGYTMLQFAWMLLKIYDKGNFTTEATLLRHLYMERSTQKAAIAKEAIEFADRSMFRCDAERWVEGENYVRVTKLMQGYIENEVNLNPEGTCGQNCNYYGVTDYYGCFKDQFCAKQRPCQGKVLQCTYYDSDMNICQAPTTSDRRYDWIEYENGVMLGKKGTCPSRFNQKVDSWWRYLFWHCSYCFCLCDDNHPSSDRYFSLREVSADVQNNKVITGVRFVKDKQVIHIQIQQGLLLEKGVIDKSTIEWIPVKSFNVMDDDVVNGVDYHTLSHRVRDIDLDDAFANKSFVLTGIQLRLVGTHLNLEIIATPFDFGTGKLRPYVESIRAANDNTDGSLDGPRSQIVLTNPDIPTRQGPHQKFSRHDEYMKFQQSSLTKDASQSTVPYIDAQPLQSGGLPLSGLGMLHRGGPQSGGFLALKLITYDFGPHITPEAPVVLK